jgi:hypothetical protein
LHKNFTLVVFLYSINSVDLSSLACYFLLSRDYFVCNFSALKTDYGMDLQSLVCFRQIIYLFLHGPNDASGMGSPAKPASHLVSKFS